MSHESKIEDKKVPASKSPGSKSPRKRSPRKQTKLVIPVLYIDTDTVEDFSNYEQVTYVLKHSF